MLKNSNGMLIIISGPSGSGKGTVVHELDGRGNFARSISMTTREPRINEVEGKDYFFRDVEEFERLKEEGVFLEHAMFNGNHYGTPVFYIEQMMSLSKYVILEIDVMGALQVRERMPDSVLIFLMPPSKKELARRLIGRNTETNEKIQERLKIADTELEYIDKYDYLVINDTVENAVHQIDAIVLAESLRPSRNIENIQLFNKI